MAEARILLAWAAGFFEGEGCFYTQWQAPRRVDGTKLAYACATLVQKDRSLLERFAAVVGFGKIYGPNPSGCFVWRADRRGQVATLISLLGPWLSLRRLNAAVVSIITERATRLESWGNRRG